MFKPKKCPPRCIYAMSLRQTGTGDQVEHCGYILYTGKSRGCEPGRGCTRYKSGKRMRSTSLQNPRRRGKGFSWDEPTGKKMWLEGKTDREIADALGVRRDTVGDCRRRKWMKETRRGL